MAPQDQKGTWYVENIHKITHFCNLSTNKPLLLLNLKLRFLTMCCQVLLPALIFCKIFRILYRETWFGDYFSTEKKKPIMWNSFIKDSLYFPMAGSPRGAWTSRSARESRTSSKSKPSQLFWANGIRWYLYTRKLTASEFSM